jgi:predicted adenylyl cyclase CyaB
MATNIEIKAKANDWERVTQIAEKLSDTPKEIIKQEDIFFPTPQGRLKLRILAPNEGQLIYYERPDAQGPKASNYFISFTDDPEALKHVLTSSYGVRGVVKKERWLYLAGPTRIHLDQVEGLGTYLELEVVMQEGEPLAAGEAIAADLMNQLGITESDLVTGAYMDLLESR